ncbi:hypothetical protein F7725_013570 [Dissostichus mawsoni]|uniref:Uncharacterized protein n=1 Tax=Dissostichus mawsoni TaxID=36200 RepID=A0A7J5Y690_DISMA|nr:hypothetical protein F7725_013570 [Dissostichus mawsoni]
MLLLCGGRLPLGQRQVFELRGEDEELGGQTHRWDPAAERSDDVGHAAARGVQHAVGGALEQQHAGQVEHQSWVLRLLQLLHQGLAPQSRTFLTSGVKVLGFSTDIIRSAARKFTRMLDTSEHTVFRTSFMLCFLLALDGALLEDRKTERSTSCCDGGRLYLLSFLLHGFIKQREAVADELLTDHHRVSQHSGRGLDISAPHRLVHVAELTASSTDASTWSTRACPTQAALRNNSLVDLKRFLI